MVEDYESQLMLFEQRHGKPVLDNMTYLYKDGATRSVSVKGPFNEPPNNEGARDRLILRYEMLRGEQARVEHNRALRQHHTQKSPEQVVGEFNRAHGPSQSDGNYFYHRDGAKRENCSNGMLWEPNADLWQRAKDIAHYWKLAEARARQEFTDFKQAHVENCKSLLTYATAHPPQGTAETVAKLKRLQAVAVEARTELEKAVKAVDDAKPADLKQRDAATATAKVALQKLMTELQAINL
jgi:hypothetical protein